MWKVGSFKIKMHLGRCRVQSNSKGLFEFGPWLKAKAASNRASRWVEFIADSNQACEEDDVGRKEPVSQE